MKRVADSHGARIKIGSSRDGGAEISLQFRKPSPQSARVQVLRAAEDTA